MPHPHGNALLPRAAAILGVLAAVVAGAALRDAGRARHPAASPPSRMTVAIDLPYGPSPLERLDVYATPSMRDAPVVAFVHGGAYFFGDKDGASGRYGMLARFFVEHGMVFVNADYRLAPRAVWPSGARDVGAIVAWLHADIARYGGDPARIALLGHSAGATHVAGYVFDPRFQPQGGPGVRAAILVSGRYLLAADPGDPANRMARVYFGADPRLWADRAPLSRVGAAPPVPVLVAVAGRENRDLAAAAAALIGRIHAAGRDGTLTATVLAGETHASEMAGIGRRASPLADEILRFLHGVGMG